MAASHATSLTSLAGKKVNVAFMTSGGLAPCLSASIGQLVHYWVAAHRAGEISGLELRFYNAGYRGILIGDSFILPESDWDACDDLNYLGGSPIGNSRVKLTNEKDCIQRGYCKEGETPTEVAARQLLKDQVDVLHTIGGDDTNTQAAHLSQYILEKHGGKVVVVGMPKTIDNGQWIIDSIVFFTNFYNDTKLTRHFYFCFYLSFFQMSTPSNKRLVPRLLPSRELNFLPM